MFGLYRYPFRYESDQFRIAVEESDSFYLYSRDCGGAHREKVITSESGTILIHPVEPLSTPKPVTRFLEIRFPATMMEPQSEKNLYLTFPLDIGVFIEGKGDTENIDVFSLNSPQYSLYGPSDRGVITRYYESRISGMIPETDPVREGVMKLTLKNSTRSWLEVSRAVFDNTNMSLSYDEIVAMVGGMDLHNNLVAETSILDRPLREGMKRSIGLSSGRRIFAEQKAFLMEHGIGEQP